jgi:hypothetical protein
MHVLSIVKNNRINFLFLLTLNALIYANYKLFISTFMVFIFLTIKNNVKFNNYETFLLRLIPLNYYFNAIYSTFEKDPFSSFFWDMQNFLHYLRCNTSSFVHNYRFVNENITCPASIGYGPLVEYIQFTFDDIWKITLILGITFFVIASILLFFSKKNLLLVVSIFISPGFHFLIFSLNTDVFVLLYICILLKYNKWDFKNFNFIVLTLLTLIKTYTVMLFFGYVIKFIIEKKYKHALLTSSYLFLNIVIIIYHYYFQNSMLPSPLSFTRSFGLLHDIKILNDNIGFNEVSYLVIFLLISATLLRKKIDLQKLEIKIHKDLVAERVIIFFPLCFLINIYSNWGYKFLFNSLLIFILYESTNQLLKILLIFTNLVATTYYLIGWGFTENLINVFIISTSKVFYYSYFIFSGYAFIIAIYKKLEKSN